MVKVSVVRYEGDPLAVPNGLAGDLIFPFIKAAYTKSKKCRKILWNGRVVRFEVREGAFNILWPIG